MERLKKIAGVFCEEVAEIFGEGDVEIFCEEVAEIFCEGLQRGESLGA